MSPETVANFLLAAGGLFTEFDPRSDDVAVPADWSQAESMTLHWDPGHRPIPDLKCDSTAICGTLYFRGSPFWCYVPWAAVSSLGALSKKVTIPCPLPSAQPLSVPSKRYKTPPVIPEGWSVIKGGKE